MVINKASNKNKIRVSIIIILMMLTIMSVSSLAWDGFSETGYEKTRQMCIAEEKDTGDIFVVLLQYDGLDENSRWLYVEGDTIKAKDIHNTLFKMIWNEHMQRWLTCGYISEFYFEEILESNANIYSDVDKTSVFFSGLKVPILTQVLNQHPPLSLMSPQIVGILPFLIGLLIAAVAFWKGLRFLFRTLRKA